jgi:S-adenosylmethionine:tRNA ribosyltransferase-isomerase
VKDSLSRYDFELPEELIAQRPVPGRDRSRLLVLDGDNGSVSHRQFSEFPRFLREGDLLVVNNTRVLPARFLGRKDGGSGRSELLLHTPEEGGSWQALVKPSRRFKPGDIFLTGPDEQVRIRVGEPVGSGSRTVVLETPDHWQEAMDLAGKMPLPPYITRPADERDSTEYQTIFARQPGAVAAPTAGLHFSDRMLASLGHLGINHVELTLHVGIGTFQPVREDDPARHRMHHECYHLPAATRRTIEETRRAGGRVIAVGTTSARTLESPDQTDWDSDGDLSADTDLFIRPPYEFKRLDGLLTNFHLPRSTLLMLVSALAGREAILAAYGEAVRERYRFFSYGDAMLILPGADAGAGGEVL